MTKSFERTYPDFDLNGPSMDGALAEVEAHFNCTLPTEYKSFMLAYDGGEGVIGRSYLILWRASELILFNEEYEVNEYAPGLLFFGSTGGGEAFAFDLREAEMSIRMVPFIGMSLEHAILIATDFDKFLARLAESNGTLLEF